MTTNLERWKYYLKDIPSPDDYIEMGFYALISAALQRRVWEGSPERPLFPNLYVILCGPPGTGKNLVIDPVTEILKYHKLKDRHNDWGSLPGAIKAATSAAQLMEEAEELIDESASDKDKKSKALPTMIPVAPDSSTFRALINSMAMGVRTIYPDPSKYNKDNCCLLKKNCYRYHSLAFALEEISTLFRKQENDIVNFFTKAYDCKDYEHITQNNGRDEINGLCLTFLGGTVPDFMREAFGNGILNHGFASRTIFVYADAPKFVRWNIGSIDKSQKVAWIELVKYIFTLMRQFGQVTFTKEAEEFGQHYAENIILKQRINCDPKLDDYYARKIMHIKKLSMAVHFADNADEYVIGIDAVEKALEILDRLELKMHMALKVGGKNPLGFIPDEVVGILQRKGPQSFIDLYMELFKHIGKRDDLKEIIVMLELKGLIKYNKDTDKYELK